MSVFVGPAEEHCDEDRATQIRFRVWLLLALRDDSAALDLNRLYLVDTSHHHRGVNRSLPPGRCIVAGCAVSSGGYSSCFVVVQRKFTLSRDGGFALRSHWRQKVTLRAKRQPVFVLVLHFILFTAGYSGLATWRVLFDG